jgi:deoxycytidylate deaminase
MMAKSVTTSGENSELILGFVGATGTDLDSVIRLFEERLPVFQYNTDRVRVSQDVIPDLSGIGVSESSFFKRIMSLMDAGNAAREKSKDNSILALGIAARIAGKRQVDNTQKLLPAGRRAMLVHSLKHPDEVSRLRQIYPSGFYLIGVHADEERRQERLVEVHQMSKEEADLVMKRDEDERMKHGQKTTDTFHLSDFFVRLDGNADRLKSSVRRIVDLLFGSPYVTPSFDEFAMFMAFSAALRSADLSRQVGAVIARENEIISTGANDCARPGGGLYWPVYDSSQEQLVDEERGRDYKRGYDSNRRAQVELARRVVTEIQRCEGAKGVDSKLLEDAILRGGIEDLTEYGRVVHAEMEALLACARNHVSCRGATVYCTTFPCHNCAKHIIAAGIRRVVFIEPYAKSRAPEFHDDSATFGLPDKRRDDQRVNFEPFVGVGPRRFFDLFSMSNGAGRPLRRKAPDGNVVSWNPEIASLRIQMNPVSYLDREIEAGARIESYKRRLETGNGDGA